MKKYALSEIFEIIGGGTPKTTNSEYWNGDIPWLSVKDFNSDEKWVDSAEKSITEKGLKESSTSILHPGDLIVSARGTVGALAMVSRDMAFNQSCYGLRAKKGFDIDYTYYLLKGTINKLKANTHGSVFDTITRDTFDQIFISVPEYEVQKKIGVFLSNLDEKIRVNTRINKNLAEQIQAFLNYVLSTGNENDAVRFGDLLYIKGRIGWKGLKKDEYLANSDYRIINGESLTPEGIDWTKTGFITQERYDESPEIMLKLGDSLLSKDGTIGKIGYIDKLDLPTTVASGIFVIRNSTKGEYGTPFLYYLLTSNRFKGFIKARTEGSVIPHLYQKDFMEFTFPKPDPELLKQFNEFSQPLFETIQNKIRENRQLAILRDKLLAKLLSGDIEIQ